MSTSHRSTAYVKSISERGRAWKPDPITSQFRFIIRMAVACHEQRVPYDLAWAVQDRRMRIVSGEIDTIHRGQRYGVPLAAIGSCKPQWERNNGPFPQV